MKFPLLFILFSINFANAQVASPTIEEKAEAVAKKFKQELGLDESTTRKVYEIKLKYLQEFSKKEKEIIKYQQQGNKKAITKIMQDLSKYQAGKVEALLTPEQLIKYKAWQKRSVEELRKKIENQKN